MNLTLPGQVSYLSMATFGILPMVPLVIRTPNSCQSVNGTNGTISKNDRSMNDVKDNLLVDTCWNRKLYFFSFVSSLHVYSPRLNSNDLDTILNGVIFPRW